MIGLLPCLHCGEGVDLNGDDIHLCRAPCNEWLDKQEEVLMSLPNGDLWDLKNHKIIKKDGTTVRNKNDNKQNI